MSRIRANQITNQSADGAPTVQNGLIISGVTTSTTFSGSGASLTNIPSAQLTGALPALDGSNLTGITQTTINNNANNRIITGSGTANTLEGEANLTYDGTDLRLGTTTAAIGGGKGLMIASSTGARIKLCDSDAGVTANDGFEIIAGNGGTGYINNKENQAIVISTNNTERMRVTHEGSVGIGTDNSTYELEVHDGTGAAALRMKDGANNVICDLIANSTGGLLRTTYNHPLVFHTNQVERVRIQTDGMTWLNKTRASSDARLRFDKQEAGSCGIDLYNVGSHKAYIMLDSEENVSYLTQSGSGHRFWTGGSTVRMQIDSSGHVTKPTNASFAVYRNVDGYGLNNQIFPFNTARYNIGGHFNTSNYRFTAPVAGRYLFNFYSIYNTSGSSHQIAYRVNNSTSNGHLIHFSHAGGWDYVSYSQMFNLSANDYVTMWSTSNIQWHGNSWQLFCGELLS